MDNNEEEIEELDEEQQEEIPVDDAPANSNSQTFESLINRAKQNVKKPTREAVKKASSKAISSMAKGVGAALKALAPFMKYILIAIAVLFGIILLVILIAAIVSTISSMFPEEDSENGATGVQGITGTDFYGARMVYSDDDKATQMLVEDYVEFVENGILEAQQITSVVANNGGETFNVELTINIILPNEDFDYSQFDETDFKSEYVDLYSIVFDIAKSVYKLDNGVDFDGVSLVQCVDGIKYFGYGNLDETSLIAKTAIINKTSFIGINDVNNKLTQNDIGLAIENELNNLYSTFSTARAEKLFVKDYIIEGEEKISGVKKENYVAMIFMARKNVTFTKFSFGVGGANLTNFTINVNGNTLSHDGNNLGTEEKQSYIYSRDLSITINEFEDIDKANLTALENEMSLFEVANLDSALTYLKEVSTGGNNSINFLTIKKNGVVVDLFNPEAYTIVEFETTWQAA